MLRTFTPADLPAVVDFWNRAYADQRNFVPLSPGLFRRRVLECSAFQAKGFILAWLENVQTEPELVGMVHAFRPLPENPFYTRWGPQPGIAHLYVAPAMRNQGIGTRLLQAAENWLYYCPIYVGAAGQACYGAVEGPRSPLFGSTQALTIDATDTATIRFFARHGYRAFEPGDVSMRLAQPPTLRPLPPLDTVLPAHLRLIAVSHTRPFAGREPQGREEYTLWGDNQGDPYDALLIVDPAGDGEPEGRGESAAPGQLHADFDGRLYGHISWYPMRRAKHAAIGSFWLSPHLRGRKLGAYLLDRALHHIYSRPTSPPPGREFEPSPKDGGFASSLPNREFEPSPTDGGFESSPPTDGGFESVEVHTHTVRHPVATRLYESRGFVLEAAWAALVKM